MENSNENNKVQTEKNEKQLNKPKEQEKKKGGRRYFNDFDLKEVKNKHGKKVKKRVYTGKYYGFVIPKEYKKNEKVFVRRIKLLYLIILIVIAALWVMSVSVTGAQGMGKEYAEVKTPMYFYVFMPNVIGALPILLIAMTLVEFVFTPGNKHEVSFADALSKNIKGQTVMLMICSGVCAVSEAIFIIKNFRIIQKPFSEISLILIMAAMIAVCLFWLKLQAGLPFEEKK